ncbi:hypothetical protein GCK72_021964 [Caenorhabditis remanei]|uniref:Uncharacterized protein n=1 Tax=Caenorhabditis remanei TaxID=31234 RepID=A0A6A5GLI9_CAERE|nr:hypothetical protein GCK72_021964 [Caenorhabditis remanei]KAF1755395.1 hypothetical protein GCK72_021964 [Caenorhabditis remanei]
MSSVRASAAGNRPMKMSKNEKENKEMKKKNKKQKTETNDSSYSSIISNDSDVIWIPEDSDIQTPENPKLLTKTERAAILKTRDLMVNFGATDGENEDNLEGALNKLEEFLGTSKLEYEAIDTLTNDLLKDIDNLAVELSELDGILVSEE